MKTRLRKIGNSKGIIIKKITIDKLELKEFVDVEENKDSLVIKKGEE